MNPSEGDHLQSVNVDPQQAATNAELDLNWLAVLCLFDVMQFRFPDLFTTMWELLKSKVHLNRDFSKIALGIPRAFAKTTFIKLWIVYCVLFTRKSFVVVISYNEDHAISILADVCRMLSSPNIIALFGHWDLKKEVDQAATKVFHFRGRQIILKGVGAKGGIRGLNYGHKRPDVIIFEDYQKKAESENEDVSNALYKDMIGTAMKTKSPFGCLYLYVANMYPTPGSILKKLKANKDWVSLVLGGIIIDKETNEPKSLWEELHPLTQLLAEYESDLNAGCPEVFLAEVLNDETAGIKAGIDITKIPVFPHGDEELPQGRAIIIDPATDNPTADYNGIGLVGLYDGVGCLEQVRLERFTPFGLIKAALVLGIQTGTRLVCVENIAYQSTLLFWFNKTCQDNGIEGFHFMPLNVGSGSKNAKIMSALKELDKKEIYIKQAVRPVLINEIIKFNPLKKNNQDTCLDLLSMVRKVIAQHGELMYMPYEAEVMAVQGAAPRLIEDNCTF